MIEKIRAINNPLTIIAIFAALAEVAGTVAFISIDKEIQSIFVWFVMLFPAALVSIFFITLNFNPKVLYAPSDFKDEVNFLNTLKGTKELQRDLAGLTKQIDFAGSEIVKQVTNQLSSINSSEQSKFIAFVKSQIETLQVKVENTKDAANVIQKYMFPTYPRSALQAKILGIINDKKSKATIDDLIQATGMEDSTIRLALRRLIDRKLVRRIRDESTIHYSLTDHGLDQESMQQYSLNP